MNKLDMINELKKVKSELRNANYVVAGIIRSLEKEYVYPLQTKESKVKGKENAKE